MVHRLYWISVIVIGLALLAVSCASPVAPTVAPTTPPNPTSPPPTAVPATVTTAATNTAEPPTPTLTLVRATATTEPATATSLPTATSEPATATAESTATGEAVAATPAAEQPGKVNLDKIFPDGKGRELVLNNCTACHSFVCVVRGQRTVDHWNTVMATHRPRVSSLSDDDYKVLFDYVKENFNDTKPEPELPVELQSLGCSGQ